MNKAVVLAAGKGTRMGELTEELPKPMLPLAGKPMIGHILDRLHEAGTEEAFIVTGYRAETIEHYLRDYPMKIIFQRQEIVNGTGTAALLAREFAGADPVLLTFGDIICDPEDYRGISSRLLENERASAVLGVKYVNDPFQGAAVYEKGGVVTRIVEKPPKGTSSTPWNSAGLYAFRREIFDHLRNITPSVRGEYELTSAVASLVTAGELVLLYEIQGHWRDVGRPEDLRAAEEIVD